MERGKKTNIAALLLCHFSIDPTLWVGKTPALPDEASY